MDKGEVTAVTANQVVAYNLRRIRLIRGLTQEGAAELAWPFLGGDRPWSKASWSAAEVSFGGSHTREFTADEILAFAGAFQIPVIWFFLPPDPGDADAVVYPGSQMGPLTPEQALEVVFFPPGLNRLQTRLSELLALLPQVPLAGLKEAIDEQVLPWGENVGALSDAAAAARELANKLGALAAESKAAAGQAIQRKADGALKEIFARGQEQP